MTRSGARFVGIVGAIFVCLAMTLEVLGPMFENWHTYGFHDWDTHTAYRYGTILSLTRYHEGPWWAPWLCGGYASWGYVEGATNLVSPYLPFYLLFKMPVALRIEVVGSAIFGFVGTYVVAGRFTRSAAVRALVAVLFAMNGRWSLQIASGHTWHLQYAWLPWLLYFYDVSLEDKRFRQVVYGGICLAMMVYMGGIYPLPQSALLLVVFGALSAIFRRSLRPILTAALISVIGVGLSAPKLLPMLDGMSRAPRIIESPEAIDLRQVILMMASPSQSFHAGPVMVPSYGWHEWGIYIGWFGVTVLVLGLLFARGKTGHPLKLTGALFFVLGLGAFFARIALDAPPQAPGVSVAARAVAVFASGDPAARLVLRGCRAELARSVPLAEAARRRALARAGRVRGARHRRRGSRGARRRLSPRGAAHRAERRVQAAAPGASQLPGARLGAARVPRHAREPRGHRLLGRSAAHRVGRHRRRHAGLSR
ncbi:MAG: hypothetical protein IPG50_29930 [Myxococcales bacterium]|nr:hypothetical protein [Myxococcales bacterium]